MSARSGRVDKTAKAYCYIYNLFTAWSLTCMSVVWFVQTPHGVRDLTTLFASAQTNVEGDEWSLALGEDPTVATSDLSSHVVLQGIRVIKDG